MESPRAHRCPTCGHTCGGKSGHAQQIILNVGGVRYETSLETLQKHPNTFLGRMFAPENMELCSVNASGEHFVDRNGRLFGFILDWYRTNELILDASVSLRAMALELDFFQVPVRLEQPHQVAQSTQERWEHCALAFTWINSTDDMGMTEHHCYTQLITSSQKRRLQKMVVTTTVQVVVKALNELGATGWKVFKIENGEFTERNKFTKKIRRRDGRVSKDEQERLDVYHLRRRVPPTHQHGVAAQDIVVTPFGGVISASTTPAMASTSPSSLSTTGSAASITKSPS